jgi:hypothetical protein
MPFVVIPTFFLLISRMNPAQQLCRAASTTSRQAGRPCAELPFPLFHFVLGATQASTHKAIPLTYFLEAIINTSQHFFKTVTEALRKMLIGADFFCGKDDF